MKNIFKVTFVIIGTLIGAGFASGQEMNLFFFSYGKDGIWGIILSSIIMGIIIYKTLKIVNKYDIKNYKEFIGKIINLKLNKKCLKNVFNVIINTFIIITFFIMIAGFGAYFKQTTGLNSLIGSSILAILSFIIFMTNVKGLVKINAIIIPILIIVIFFVGFLNLKEINFNNLDFLIKRNNYSNWILSSVLYCSYNTIVLVPTLITLRSYLKSQKSVILISIISAGIVISLSLVLYFLLVKVDVDISAIEMPVVYVVSNMSVMLKILYGFVIISSIFTTATSLGISFLNNISKNKKSYSQIAIIMCITSIGISQFGFSNLVNLLYPIFGYIGIFQNILIIKKNS